MNTLIKVSTILIISLVSCLCIISASILLLQSSAYLKYAYTKLSLPAANLDPAKLTLIYLIFNQEKPLLGLYSPIELGHLRDVKRLTDINRLLFAFSLVTLLVLRKSPLVRHSLVYGGITAISLVLIIFIATLTSWESFFIFFHELFFPQGNWAFPADSTLIQLFPEVFWYTAFRAVGVLTVIFAAVFIILGKYLSNRAFIIKEKQII
jgi:integral membrane protein (TIGR01906 family)